MKKLAQVLFLFIMLMSFACDFDSPTSTDKKDTKSDDSLSPLIDYTWIETEEDGGDDGFYFKDKNTIIFIEKDDDGKFIEYDPVSVSKMTSSSFTTTWFGEPGVKIQYLLSLNNVEIKYKREDDDTQVEIYIKCDDCDIK